MGIDIKTLNTLWINGEKLEVEAKRSVKNPANGEKVGEFSDGGRKETSLAIEAASVAFPQWAKLTAEARNEYLLKWSENIEKNKEKLALLLTTEQGKSINEARGEIEGCRKLLQWFTEEGRRIYGEIIPASNPNQKLFVYKEPLGVVGLITPMNFPAATVMRKVGSSLAAGCTIILKPSGQTPLIASALFELLIDTGIPKGVANFVTGNSNEIGTELMEDSRVRKVSFTGSTIIGKKLMDQASRNVKQLSLELGGNSPAIIFPDADLDKAVELVVANKFENCGQVCNGINLIYVHKDILEEFTEKLVEKVSTIRVNVGTEEDCDIGPLIDRGALDKVHALVVDAQEMGAEVLIGGKQLIDEQFKNGNFYAPTIVTSVTNEMKISQEEIFGPVATILSFTDEEEVIKVANATPYGLAAYIFTNDLARINRLIAVDGIEAGNIAVNGTSLAYVQAPFGGVKESGMGREGGKQGLEEYCELKYVVLNY
ncbi:NAD-dependent succinate-semialdehyde dehydrogenase [Psychrobacillus sp. NEAU-3TGS]|uniref:NAD-dependent succinate-semialdehyde dehydrogenase n=1 Tax=Psychrobacillus sp. NEAU-3TGS TaxID=2995412 RepID=UPI00249781CD|nr:NAD-dependent succinate-semialdehyde dehydrogenase [Psychrobacillus sp. NEAU-3TGS]MDI2587635.1 NAD-dependent succinate-semialdehyde dehydrogenase [Psychrobacillus sp. NEAU-3TGS]